jgi:hypothetical protein
MMKKKANSPVVQVVQLESPLERLSDCRTVPYPDFSSFATRKPGVRIPSRPPKSSIKQRRFRFQKKLAGLDFAPGLLLVYSWRPFWRVRDSFSSRFCAKESSQGLESLRMFDASSITAALGSAKTILDLLKNANDAQLAMKISSEVANLQGKLIDVQQQALALQQDNQQLRGEIEKFRSHWERWVC